MDAASDWFREVQVSASGVAFKVWSPGAEAVNLYLYTSDGAEVPWRVEPLRRLSDGFWGVSLSPDVQHHYYEFRVQWHGRWLEPTPGVSAYAVGVNGRRGYITTLTAAEPAGWTADAPPPFSHPSDAVIYELHHRDFSASPDSGTQHHGRYLSLSQMGTRTPGGLYSCLSHLVELGVTHVHLMPSFDFASVDESRPDIPQYNWGYDPLNYNVPEGSYSTDAFDPLCRIREFRAMVMAIHQAGLRVVLDVVYNHTYTVDGSNFQRMAPDSFFRKNPDGTWAGGSGCGNETASERPCMRRFMIESLKHWMRDYHIDGFRFDVMGLHDVETMNQIVRELTAIDPAVLLYGEGWSCAPARLPQGQAVVKTAMARVQGVAAFGDELRDGMRGLWTDQHARGFLLGAPDSVMSVRFGITAGVYHPQVDYDKVYHAQAPWAVQPTQMVNYVGCHDDLCLADRIAATGGPMPVHVQRELCALAFAVLLTSQGIPFLAAGDEMMRSKYGDANSYKSGDAVNAISWALKDRNVELARFVQGLIALRRSRPHFRLHTAAEVAHCITFLHTTCPSLLSYKIASHAAWLKGHPAIYLFFNSSSRRRRVWVKRGGYMVLCRGLAVSASGLGVSHGGYLTIPARSALILEVCTRKVRC